MERFNPMPGMLVMNTPFTNSMTNDKSRQPERFNPQPGRLVLETKFKDDEENVSKVITVKNIKLNDLKNYLFEKIRSLCYEKKQQQ